MTNLLMKASNAVDRHHTKQELEETSLCLRRKRFQLKEGEEFLANNKEVGVGTPGS